MHHPNLNHQLDDARERLEGQIKAALDEFTAETGLHIHSIDLAEYQNTGWPSPKYKVGVNASTRPEWMRDDSLPVEGTPI